MVCVRASKLRQIVHGCDYRRAYLKKIAKSLISNQVGKPTLLFTSGTNGSHHAEHNTMNIVSYCRNDVSHFSSFLIVPPPSLFFSFVYPQVAFEIHLPYEALEARGTRKRFTRVNANMIPKVVFSCKTFITG